MDINHLLEMYVSPCLSCHLTLLMSLMLTYIKTFYIITFIAFPFMIFGLCVLFGKLPHPKLIKIFYIFS